MEQKKNIVKIVVSVNVLYRKSLSSGSAVRSGKGKIGENPPLLNLFFVHIFLVDQLETPSLAMAVCVIWALCHSVGPACRIGLRLGTHTSAWTEGL